MIECGGKGIRTPDFQLAKLALYQLSYAPCELSILDCGSRIANVRERATSANLRHGRPLQIRQKAEAGWRCCYSPSGSRALVRTGEAAFVRYEKRSCFPYCPPTGTAKYAINEPVAGSIALPVISPLLFMSFALARKAGALPLTSLRSVG